LSLGEQQDSGGKCQDGRGFGFHGGPGIMDSANLRGHRSRDAVPTLGSSASQACMERLSARGEPHG
jgi:hypothetical protein